jgi:hypothetical protein
MDLNEVGYEHMGWIYAAKDRGQLLGLVNTQ